MCEGEEMVSCSNTLEGLGGHVQATMSMPWSIWPIWVMLVPQRWPLQGCVRYPMSIGEVSEGPYEYRGGDK
jgi:hypothetical protein